MTNRLTIRYSEHSDAGVKTINQDACRGYIPTDNALELKGGVFVLADGISSSTVSQVASDIAIQHFIKHYYCTSEAWSVAQSANMVIQGLNASLYAKTQQSAFCYTPDKGYVCTFSAVIIKGDTAHIFHVGDARISLFRDGHLETLTRSHRIAYSSGESYLSNALGFSANVEIDYKAIPLTPGDIIVLMTDGVYEFVASPVITQLLNELNADFDQIAPQVVNAALKNGSDDNVSFQAVSITETGSDTFSFPEQGLPVPPPISEGTELDGYFIQRLIYQSARSSVYLATDTDTNEGVTIKVPSTDLATNQDYLKHFVLEEWVARRISSPHVIASPKRLRAPQYLYCVNEFIEGRNLAQWLVDNPKPSIEKVRVIIEQVATGLMAMHREGILHQDLRPENVMIEESGNSKVIDLGSARVAGISEMSFNQESEIMGTAAYVAPEYFLGDSGCEQSDLFSLAVLTYYLLSDRFPYGTQVAKSRTVAAQNRLKYQSVLQPNREIPAWIDATLKRALHPNPEKRYPSLSEFIFNLRQPSPAFLNRVTAPLIERYPLRFWQGLSLILLITNLITAVLLNNNP